MSKYTIKDVSNIVPEDLTATQIAGVEAYLNEGIIPPVDPCISCEPNFIRKLISLIQIAERNGYFPPKRVEEPTYEKFVIRRTDLAEEDDYEELDELEKDLIEQEVLDARDE